MKKPRIGIFKYSCCAGCEFQLIYFQKYVFEVFGAVDLIYCRMASSGGVEGGPFDIALIEGAITDMDQIEQLKRVRESSRYLIPIGSCAVNGGIPAIKSMQNELDMEKSVYADVSVINSVRPHAVDEYVKVDAYLKGCPIGDRDLFELVTSILLGKKRADLLEYCVCVECKLKGNTCVLVANDEPCMGPVVNAGCGALCPSNDRPCYACWGPMGDANTHALAQQFEKMGLSRDEIVRKFTLFASIRTEFRKVAKEYE